MVLIDFCINVWLYFCFVFCYKYLKLMLEEFLEIVIYYVFKLIVKFINYINIV